MRDETPRAVGSSDAYWMILGVASLSLFYPWRMGSRLFHLLNNAQRKGESSGSSFSMPVHGGGRRQVSTTLSSLFLGLYRGVEKGMPSNHWPHRQYQPSFVKHTVFGTRV